MIKPDWCVPVDHDLIEILPTCMLMSPQGEIFASDLAHSIVAEEIYRNINEDADEVAKLNIGKPGIWLQKLLDKRYVRILKNEADEVFFEFRKDAELSVIKRFLQNFPLTWTVILNNRETTVSKVLQM